jgi:hypothetical protein
MAIGYRKSGITLLRPALRYSRDFERKQKSSALPNRKALRAQGRQSYTSPLSGSQSEKMIASKNRNSGGTKVSESGKHRG